MISTLVSETYYPRLGFDESFECDKMNKRCSKPSVELFQNDPGCRDKIVKKRLGSGAYGHVYDSCCGENNCKYVTKTMIFRNDFTPFDFHTEILYGNVMAKADIGPKLVEAFRTPTEAVIVMEKLEGPTFENVMISDLKLLKDLSKSNWKHYSAELGRARGRQIGKLLEKVHRLGIIHGDSHSQNIILDNRDNRFRLIDFGRSEPIKKEIDILDDYRFALEDIPTGNRAYTNALIQQAKVYMQRDVEHLQKLLK